MIGKKRQERIWNHLLELERQTGMPLRESPDEECSCPIWMFRPEVDRNGLIVCPSAVKMSIEGECYYHAYELEDAEWWRNLNENTRRQTINWLIKKIQERR